MAVASKSSPALPVRGLMGRSGSAHSRHKSPASSATASAHAAPAPLRGLIFEIADVLYDTTAWRRWLMQLLGRLAVPCDPRTFYDLWDNHYLPSAQCGQRDLRAAFREFLAAMGYAEAQVDEIEAASRLRRAELESDIRPFPAVVKTLRRLAADGLVLGVLTNATCPAAELRAKLERLGLDGAFETVCSSFDLQQCKPSPTCYQQALNALQLRACQVAYVGHHRAALIGAKAAGLRSVAFANAAAVECDAFAGRFDDLCPIADRWRQIDSASAEPVATAATRRATT